MRGRDINLDIDAGRGETLTIKPLREGGEVWDFSGVTVSGELRDIRTDETVSDLDCGVTADGKIVVDFPAMSGGQYVFAVDMSGEDGGATRLVDGYVTWGEPKAVIREGEESEEQCLLVYVEGARRKAVWAWSNEAERMYEAAKNEAEKAADSAERAENAAESVNGAAQVKLLKEFNDALKEFDGKVANAVKPNTTTNTWWIAGVDSGVQVTGDKGDIGFCPYINSHGNWIAGDESGNGFDTGVKARGRDGVDGSAIRRVLVDALPELPTNEAEAVAHRGIFYIIPVSDGYDVYALMETLGGTFAWVNVGDSNALASTTLYGLVKLGTDETVSGAPVGANASGGLAVPAATTVDAGVVIKSRSLVDRYSTNVPTVEGVRAFIEQYYYTKTQADSQISGVTSDIAEVRGDVDSLTSDMAGQDKVIAELRASIAVIEKALGTRPTKTEVDEAINAAYERIVNEVKSELVEQLSADDYAATTPKDGVLYLIPEE